MMESTGLGLEIQYSVPVILRVLSHGMGASGLREAMTQATAWGILMME
jgi:hypothetical protein